MQENVQVVFCILQIGVFLRQDSLKNVVSFRLCCHSFAELLGAVVDLGEGRVSLSGLKVALAEHVGVLVDVVGKCIRCGFLVVDLLIHHSEIQVHIRNFRVVVSTGYLEDAECTPHVIEASREVPSAMVVHRQLRIV